MGSLFITGGNGEIGQAIINTFSENGYQIIAPSSKELDCGSNESIGAYFKKFISVPIAAFVHCAGINNPKDFMEVSPATISRTVQINTLSFLYITQYLNPFLKNGMSKIVAISSIYGTVSRNKRLEYATSKHGLKGIVQSLSIELAQRNILVNSVSPGFIATKLTYKNNSPEVIEKLISGIPLKKLGQPKYVAELTYFLCCEKNNFITGQDIIIDGGYLAGGFQS